MTRAVNPAAMLELAAVRARTFIDRELFDAVRCQARGDKGGQAHHAGRADGAIALAWACDHITDAERTAYLVRLTEARA